MEENYTNDDTFLARWIAGELSEEERIAFEKTEAYKEFNTLNKVAKTLAAPTVDTESALTKVKAKLKANTTKTKVIKLWISVAASIAILIGSYAFLQSSVTYTTAIGEKIDITLEDGSVVNLNSNSSLTHKRFFWKDDKKLSLSGEAYFTVTKGKGFHVKTNHGIVSVLGTQFNIKTQKLGTEVKCYTGKVQYKNEQHLAILTKGFKAAFQQKTGSFTKDTFNKTTPDWKQGFSSYKNQDFATVLTDITNYYPIKIDNQNVNINRVYTGVFVHNNLNQALQTTLGALGIKYQLSKDGTTLVISK
ncbi:FecR family protein [Wenyingzhuangia sp. IMCC45574]